MADAHIPPPSYARLRVLSALETSDNPRTPRLTTNHHLEKTCIVDSLHGKCFFVKDSQGYPLKLDVPGNWKDAVGVEHHFDARDWVSLTMPEGRGMDGIAWPPKDAGALLEVGEDEGVCVGCLVKRGHAHNEDVLLYAAALEKGNCVVYWDGKGYVWGVVEENMKSREVLVLRGEENGDEAGNGKTSKKRLRDGETKETEKKTVEVPWLAVLIKEEEAERKPCSCDFEIWKKREKKWYKRFELRGIDTRIVGLFSLRYMPANRVIGETIGLLLPDESDFSAPDGDSKSVSLTETAFESIADEIKHCWPVSLGRPEDSAAAIYATIENYVFGNFTRYVRHSCDPNSERKECRLGNRRMNVLLSIRAIAKEEEVTEDLGYEYVKAVGSCDCGSDRCWLKRHDKEIDLHFSAEIERHKDHALIEL